MSLFKAAGLSSNHNNSSFKVGSDKEEPAASGTITLGSVNSQKTAKVSLLRSTASGGNTASLAQRVSKRAFHAFKGLHSSDATPQYRMSHLDIIPPEDDLPIDESLFNVDESLFNVDESLFNVDESLFNVDESLFNVDESLFNVDESLFNVVEAEDEFDELTEITHGLEKRHIDSPLLESSGRSSSWTSFVEFQTKSRSATPSITPTRSGRSSSNLRLHSSASNEESNVKSELSESERLEFEKILNSFSVAHSHNEVCKRIKKAMKFIHTALPDAPIAQSRYLQSISDGILVFLVSLDDHMPFGVKRTNEYQFASSFKRIYKKITAHINLFRSTTFKGGAAFFDLIDALDLEVDELRRQEAFILSPDATLKDLEELLTVSSASQQFYSNNESRSLEGFATNELTILDLLKYEYNERFVIATELREQVSALDYPYKSGERDSVREKAIEANRSRLAKRGVPEDKIKEELQDILLTPEAYRDGESQEDVSSWVKDINTQRQQLLEMKRSDYKDVILGPSATTIIEFSLKDRKAHYDKYIFEIIVNEETGNESVVARLFFDKNDDASPRRDRGKRHQSRSSEYSDVDSSPPTPGSSASPSRSMMSPPRFQ